MAPAVRFPSALLAILAALSIPPVMHGRRHSGRREAYEATQVGQASASVQAAALAGRKAEWMYADTWNTAVASMDPYRWSSPLTEDQLIAELESRKGGDSARPVIVSVGDLQETCSTVEEVRALFERFRDPARFVPIEDMVPNFDCGAEYGFADTDFGHGFPDLVASAPSWCNASLMPEEKRVPPQLRGLYWMKDLPLDDTAFCTSLAEYDHQKRQARMAVWTTFVFHKNTEEDVAALARKAASLPMFKKPLVYTLTFTDDSMTEATISANIGVLNSLIKFPLKALDETPDGTIKSEQPGDIFDRPSFVMGHELTDSRYFAVRIMEDSGRVFQDRYELMKEQEGKRPGTLVRYANKC